MSPPPPLYMVLLHVIRAVYMQGPETDMARVDKLCKLSQKGYASSMVVTNHSKKVCRYMAHS